MQVETHQAQRVGEAFVEWGRLGNVGPHSGELCQGRAGMPWGQGHLEGQRERLEGCGNRDFMCLGERKRSGAGGAN